ncbi:MAG: glycosyltransferase family 4 protein [Deltaproteobacteria bacterium]|nr:glycosyltransferase family 4 protein [Deltaproteobacteria bacterium]
MPKYGKSISRRRLGTMRIGIDATSIFLRKGGIGYYTYNLLENLTRIDMENEYVLFTTTQNQPEAPIPFIARPNVRVLYTPKWLQKWRCGKERIDLYHGTNFRLRGRGQKGNVVTIHDLAFKHYPHFLKKKYGQSLSSLKTKWGVQRADRVIAVSKHTAGDVVEFFKIDRGKIRVVYHGVDDSFRPDVPLESIIEVKKKYGILSPRYILWVGTIEPRKNLSTLIQVYSQLEMIHAEYSLVFGGGLGWQYKNVLNLNRSFENRMRITGYLPPGDLIPLYAGASLFVYPSLYEGFGMPLLEAMASGVPIIAANTSSIPEVIGDAGILIDPLNITEIKEAVERVLFDNSLSEFLKAKGIQRAKSFTWEKAAQETLTIYQEAVDQA